MAEVTMACANELDENIFLQAGGRFLRAYYRIVLQEKNSVVVLAVDDCDPDRVLGFVTGSLDAAASAEVLCRHKLTLAIAALPAMLLRPSLLRRLRTRLRATSSMNSAEEYVVGKGARAAFMAMLPEARAGGEGVFLFYHWLATMRALGAREIRLEVDVANARVVAIHKRLGAAVIKEVVTPDGKARVFMEYPAPT
jgi:hypothetical protein